jgi:hypothetical protein
MYIALGKNQLSREDFENVIDKVLERFPEDSVEHAVVSSYLGNTPPSAQAPLGVDPSRLRLNARDCEAEKLPVEKTLPPRGGLFAKGTSQRRLEIPVSDEISPPSTDCPAPDSGQQPRKIPGTDDTWPSSDLLESIKEVSSNTVEIPCSIPVRKRQASEELPRVAKEARHSTNRDEILLRSSIAHLRALVRIGQSAEQEQKLLEIFLNGSSQAEEAHGTASLSQGWGLRTTESKTATSATWWQRSSPSIPANKNIVYATDEDSISSSTPKNRSTSDGHSEKGSSLSLGTSPIEIGHNSKGPSTKVKVLDLVTKFREAEKEQGPGARDEKKRIRCEARRLGHWMDFQAMLVRTSIGGTRKGQSEGTHELKCSEPK